MSSSAKTPGIGKLRLEPRNSRKLKEGTHGYSESDVITWQHSYPLKILIPDHVTDTECCWIYPITFGGGLVGGDKIDLDVSLGKNVCAVVTSQESTKVHVCEDSTVTENKLHCQVGDDSLLCLLADPVVCYKDANFRQEQVVQMSPKGNVVMLDWLVGGRVALGELWHFKSYCTLMEVHVGETLVLREANHLEDKPYQTVEQTMKHFQVYGTCVVLGKHVQHLSDHLTSLYGKPRTITDTISMETVCSISPLKYSVGGEAVTGCYLRFLATTTTRAYEVVKEIVEPLLPILGADPFQRKY